MEPPNPESVLNIATPPGADAYSAELTDRLQQALIAKGDDYQPRTQYLLAKNRPKYTNRLLFESSTYLQQHAHNPVNWYPWGEEAFAAAKALGRPVLLSIGYSTCHWCHVMEEESYDNEETAKIINQGFIAIKVDREVRPDVDEIYMTALHAMGKQGGWPLNVWLTADKQPFFGGTYFPPEDGNGRLGFKQLLLTIQQQYRDNHADIQAFAEKLSTTVKTYIEGNNIAAAESVATIDVLEKLVTEYATHFDMQWGGFKRAPKFPSSLSLNALMHAQLRWPEAATEEMINTTLTKMAQGGMHDQIGGGFHRYSTDAKWLVPHFEKMLYDNALLAQRYTQGWLLTKKPYYQATAKRTLDYVLKEMTSAEGGFYSATDADSLGPHGEMEEGYYFSWTPDELASMLSTQEMALASLLWGINAQGNFEGRSIPTGWTSLDQTTAEQLLAKTGLIPEQAREMESAMRAKLYDARQQRAAPLRDEKQIVEWNGLMISAFAKAGFHFSEPRYLAAAEGAAIFILTKLVKEQRLQRVYHHGSISAEAFLEDYAFFIAALLDLYETTHSPQWLEAAVELQASQDSLYQDTVNGGYFRTSDDHEELLAREKNQSDGAVPSGNSYAVLNLLRLFEFTQNPSYKTFAELTLKSVTPILNQQPTQLAEMMPALDFYHSEIKEVVLIGNGDAAALEPLLTVVKQYWLPNKILIVTDESDIAEQEKLLPLLGYKKALQGKPTAYVCYNKICELPTQSVSVLTDQLLGGE